MSISSVSSSSSAAAAGSATTGNDAAVASLEQRAKNLSTQIEATNKDQTLDAKTKAQKLVQLQTQLAQVQAEIAQLRAAAAARAQAAAQSKQASPSRSDEPADAGPATAKATASIVDVVG